MEYNYEHGHMDASKSNKLNLRVCIRVNAIKSPIRHNKLYYGILNHIYLDNALWYIMRL